MRIPVIVQIIMSFVSSQILYPQLQGLPIQWINQGLWHHCSNGTIIDAQNCYYNDDKFIECYEVPDQGLCSDTITLTQDPLFSLMSFNKTDKSSFCLSINGIEKIQFYNVNGSITIAPFKNPQVPFKIKLYHTAGDQLFLTKLNVLPTTLSARCIKQDLNDNCQQCEETFFLYEMQCIPKVCLTQLSDLVSNGISQRLSYLDGNVVQEFIINNILELGDCIVPRLYLIKNLEDPQMVYMFPKKYLTRPDNRSVLLTIPIGDLPNIPFDNLETSTEKVFQGYVSFTATVQDQSQFQYITLIRVGVNKNISSNITYNDQGFVMPDQCCQSLFINLLSEAKILKITKSGDKTYIYAQQQSLDPLHRNLTIKFESASLIGDQHNTLQLINSTMDQNTMSITYCLLIDPQANIKDSNTTIQISSSLAAIGRMLDSRAHNIKPSYVLSTTVNLYSKIDDIDSTGNQVSYKITSRGPIIHQNMDFTGLYILLIVVISLFVIVVAFNMLKSYRREYIRNKQFYSTDSKIVVSSQQLD